ncbi:hypothetical protein [Niabella soli]|uniref:Uncharacterized protein n=1 Tax=Niabella soli DSM 19437 TaxID=929713 RepID=W0F7T7_9BACT|nr:hypothetical protein [Niabella soli]AHF17524.1 hypothetical protein NIASO_09215 [Niabella soli DSM 19437]
MIPFTLKSWFRTGLVSLSLVALYGALMRCKIAFALPLLQQKNLLHAHSHFAFTGWISHCLYCGLALLLAPYLPGNQQKKYRLLISLNMLFGMGMLVAFTLEGYKAISIVFSTLTIFTAMAFAVCFIKDAGKLPPEHAAKPWAITGLLLNVLSSAGPFSLAYMMAGKNINTDFYLGSIYYYLHFQYNGWFFFGTMALAAPWLKQRIPSLNYYYKIFCFTIIPTLFLSLLWIKLPLWLYGITVAAAIAQLTAWVLLLIKGWPIIRQQFSRSSGTWVTIFFYTATLAITLKILLQAVSAIPSLSQLVFGFRPVVIAYLHLVLLGAYSLFYIGFLFSNGLLIITKTARCCALLFLSGVVLNELCLTLQGIAAFIYRPVPYINELLFVAALVLLTSIVLLTGTQLIKNSPRKMSNPVQTGF